MSHTTRAFDLASRPGGGGDRQATPKAECSCDTPGPAQAGLTRRLGARLVGVVTFLRLVQSSFEDIAFAHRIGRLRDFYLQVCPALAPYPLVVHGAGSAPICGADLPPGRSIGQLTLTTAGMVAVVNSVVAAACSGVALEAVAIYASAAQRTDPT